MSDIRKVRVIYLNFDFNGHLYHLYSYRLPLIQNRTWYNMA